MAVYGRVQEHDPGNARAAAACAALAAGARAAADAVRRRPAPAAPRRSRRRPAPRRHRPAGQPPAAADGFDATAGAAGDDFVDLGLDDPRGEPRRATPACGSIGASRRTRTSSGSSRRSWSSSSAASSRTSTTDDYQAHYDLGVAFKEMGLLDEAIAEFQKALRAPEGAAAHVRGARHGLLREGPVRRVGGGAAARGRDALDDGDDAKIGLLYWLGRACEAQGKDADAITSYERAMAVDIRFMDLGERMHRLTRGAATNDLRRPRRSRWPTCSVRFGPG